MKSFFHSHIIIVLLALVPFISSCEQEMAEPMLPATQSTETIRLTEDAAENDKIKFQDGNHIFQFQKVSSLNLITNQDIEILAEEIAIADLTFIDYYNFDGFKGGICYLTKQQARRFHNDARVLVIEPDAPIIPLQSR